MIKINDYEPMHTSLFPNGEIKIAPLNDYLTTDCGYYKADAIVVTLKYESSEDLINLYFIKKNLDNLVGRFSQHCKIFLDMPYIPYERMDRQTDHQMPTCKYFCEFINSLKFDRVMVLDPHSHVSENLLNNLTVLDINFLIQDVIDLEKAEDNWFKLDVLFFPDGGANKKYSELLKDFEQDYPFIWGNKHRDLDTGKITDYQVIGDIDVKGKTILIVDDLCVKGYTTLFAAKKLKELGAKRVIFYCSHCEPAIAEGELLTSDYVDKIYTTDSLLRNIASDKLHTISL